LTAGFKPAFLLTDHMVKEKLEFITGGAFKKLELLDADSKAKWGVMNPQEMTEHLADFFDVSTEKVKTKLYTPEEHLPRYMEFLMSEKEFKENTKAPTDLLGEKPLPIRFPSLAAAKENLKKSVNNFVDYFSEDKMKRTLHPAFGMLNFEEWVRLHYKHVVHHLKQFNVVAE
jgi:hypothetical protein